MAQWTLVTSNCSLVMKRARALLLGWCRLSNTSRLRKQGGSVTFTSGNALVTVARPLVGYLPSVGLFRHIDPDPPAR